ncbi:MAG: SusC/RagA family protein, partial [Paludibacter sp.]
LKINFTSIVSVQTRTKDETMLSADEYRNLINSSGTNYQKSLLGKASTKWNNEIFRTALATNNQISLIGGLFNRIPFRASMGHTGQDGILRTDRAEKLMGSMVLTPSFFDHHLNINFNLRTSQNNNRFANKNAISEASVMNPTQPVTSDESVYTDNFGGYWQSYISSSLLVAPNSLSVKNPVATLNLTNETSNDQMYAGKIDVDYKIHFLPDLHIKFMYGLNTYHIDDQSVIEKTNPSFFGHGRFSNYLQNNTYKTINTGLKYNKKINDIHQLDAIVAYEWQHYNYVDSSKYVGLDGYNLMNSRHTSERYTVSFLGQVSYTYNNACTLTLGMRKDGSSQFSTNNRWANAPSASLTYNLCNGIFNNIALINSLKVRFSYGVTGQNNIPINTYSMYNQDLKAESTKSYDFTIDYGFLNNRIYGSLDLFTRKTSDLINYAIPPLGSNQSLIQVNSGSLYAKGIEFTINAEPIRTTKLSWTIGLNATLQNSTIADYPYPYVLSPYSMTSSFSLIDAEGNAPNMFYVLNQKYDNAGKPIEGQYEDVNADGILNYGDRVEYHSPNPYLLLGFNTQLIYRRWSTGCSLRANVGNYVYNMINSQSGIFSTYNGNTGSIGNISRDYLNTGFKNYQQNSSYYVEDASFLKMDYLSVNYNVGEIANGLKLKVGAVVQNVFTISQYSGADPEVPNGIDNGFYPRPRVCSLSASLDF